MPAGRDVIIVIVEGTFFMLVAVLLVMTGSRIATWVDIAYRDTVITYRTDVANMLTGAFMLIIHGAVFLQTILGMLSTHASIRHYAINVRTVKGLLKDTSSDSYSC